MEVPEEFRPLKSDIELFQHKFNTTNKKLTRYWDTISKHLSNIRKNN